MKSRKRCFFALLLTLPLSAQEISVRCEPPPETLRLLEAVPSLRDTAIPYEQRVGALRALAGKHPDDFFIQRAYQDSFRGHRDLADEYDRALARYRARPADPLSQYYEARLLMWSEPQRAREIFEKSMRAQPQFVWPHRDMMEWALLPGRRADPEMPEHQKAFREVCGDAFGMPGSRPALERRNTPLELSVWPQVWGDEEKAGEAPEVIAGHIRGDLARIEAWPFRADPELHWVYQEAARILKDPGIMQTLRAKVEREAPGSSLALSFVQDDWEKANPVPDRNAPPAAWKQRQEKETQAQREWLRHWPDAWPLLSSLLMNMSSRATGAPATVSAGDLEIIDQVLRVRAMSPDGGEFWPPVETAIARIYVDGKVRLDRVPALLDAGLRNVEKMCKYQFSMELFPAEMRARATDWRAITAKRTEEIRADYLLAMNRPADARGLIEQALHDLEAPHADSRQQSDDRAGWLRRLAITDAQEGRVEDALAHYQASMAGWSRKGLAMPEAQPMFAAVKQYYLAHGGTEEKWPDWATSGSKVPWPEPRPPSFVKELPEFSIADLAGRTWELRNLKGKATFINFWATWCGPCRGEHPGIQELYDRTRERADVQVLTFSVDDDAASARQYMKEKGYTFPVVCAPELADKLFPYAGLPTSFVVNPQGMRTSLYGFSTDSSGVGRLIEFLAKVARGGP
jgi:thiol-disulfide isomerase/thioredoxin